MIITVKNNASLQALLKEHSKVILMCKAAFVCQPCNIAYPIYEELHKQNLNTDILFLEMKIQLIEDVTPTPKGFPTFIIFKDGVEVERVASSNRGSIEGLLNKLKDESVQPQPTIAPTIAVPTVAPAAPNNSFLSKEEVDYLYKFCAIINGGDIFLAMKNSYTWVNGMPELNQRVCEKPYPVYEFRHTQNMQSFQLTNAENYELLGVERKEVNGKLEKLNVVNIAAIWLTDGSYEFRIASETYRDKVNEGELLFLPKGTSITGIVLHKNMIA